MKLSCEGWEAEAKQVINKVEGKIGQTFSVFRSNFLTRIRHNLDNITVPTLIDANLNKTELTTLVEGLSHKLFNDELAPEHNRFLRNDDLRYVYFSALWYVDIDVLTANMINKLQNGASLLTIGSGPAHLERLLQQGFGIKNITCSDVNIHPTLQKSALEQYQFCMLNQWPKFNQKFDFIVFPESFSIAMPYSPADCTFRSIYEIKRIENRVLEGNVEQLSNEEINTFLKIIDQDVHSIQIKWQTILKAIANCKPGGQIFLTNGMSNGQQKAYFMLKLHQFYPGIKIIPSNDIGLYFELPAN